MKLYCVVAQQNIIVSQCNIIVLSFINTGVSSLMMAGKPKMQDLIRIEIHNRKCAFVGTVRICKSLAVHGMNSMKFTFTASLFGCLSLRVSVCSILMSSLQDYPVMLLWCLTCVNIRPSISGTQPLRLFSNVSIFVCRRSQVRSRRTRAAK